MTEGSGFRAWLAAELWSTSEVMEHLGLSKSRVHQLADQYPDELTPIKILADGRGNRIWLAEDWRAFAKRPRPPGRPPKSP